MNRGTYPACGALVVLLPLKQTLPLSPHLTASDPNTFVEEDKTSDCLTE